MQALYDQGPDAVVDLANTFKNTVEVLTAHVKQLEDRIGKDSHYDFSTRARGPTFE